MVINLIGDIDNNNHYKHQIPNTKYQKPAIQATPELTLACNSQIRTQTYKTMATQNCANIFNEPRVIKPKKVNKPLEGLSGCANIFKEPKAIKPKKVNKPLEGLYGCVNIFKEPKAIKPKKVNKPLEGLSGCVNIFKEPKVRVAPKTKCGLCGMIGHNKRTCHNQCQPCSDQTTRDFCFAGLSAAQATLIAKIL